MVGIVNTSKHVTPKLLASLRCPVKGDYENGVCPHCQTEIPVTLLRGQQCAECDAVLFDLFEFYDAQPLELHEITKKYDELFEAGEISPYKLCQDMLVEVNLIGFTFDYELDMQPLALRVAAGDHEG